MAQKDKNTMEEELLDEDQAYDDAAENETDEIIEEDEYDEGHDHEDVDHVSLSSRILRILTIFFVGVLTALWAGPKLAPLLPAGLKPVADFLAPQSDSSVQIASLKADFEKRFSAMERDRGQLTFATIEPKIAQLDATDVEVFKSVDGLSASIKALEQSLEKLQTDLAEVNARQVLAVNGGSVSDEALKQFEEQLAAITSAQQELSQGQTKALSAQQDAEGKLRMASAANTISRISSALEKGIPFEEELSQLSKIPGLNISANLVSIGQAGTPSFVNLKRQFPQVARSALREEAAVNSGDGIVSKFSSFLKSQVGSRSLEPKQGEDLDAVLSRMEGSLNSGDLDTVLSEAKVLSVPAKKTMGVWLQSLENLNDALNSIHSLETQLATVQN